MRRGRRDQRGRLRRRRCVRRRDDDVVRARPLRSDELSDDVRFRRRVRAWRFLQRRFVRAEAGERRDVRGLQSMHVGVLQRRRVLQQRLRGSMRGVQPRRVGRHVLGGERRARRRANGVRERWIGVRRELQRVVADGVLLSWQLDVLSKRFVLERYCDGGGVVRSSMKFSDSPPRGRQTRRRRACLRRREEAAVRARRGTTRAARAWEAIRRMAEMVVSRAMAAGEGRGSFRLAEIP